MGLRYASDEITSEENLFRYAEAAGEFLDSGALGLDLAIYNIINGGLVADASHIGGWAPTEKAVNGGIPVSLSVYRAFRRKDETVTWRVNLDWNYTDSAMLYLSATTGTRAGGYNLVFFSASPTYEPEELLAYELGSKSQFLDNTIQLNASVYIYDYKSIHTFITEVTPPLIPGERAGLTTSVLSAPGVDIWGIEADVLWLATDNWTLGGNFSYTPSEYSKDLFVKDVAALDTPESLFRTFDGQVKNIKGNQILQVADWKYTAWASYGWPLSGGSKLEFFGVYSWIDDVYYSPFESEEEKAEAYDRTDLRVTWTSASTDWTVTAFVNNVFDDVGVLQVLAAGEAESFRHSAGTTVPRLYGLEVTYSVGN